MKMERCKYCGKKTDKSYCNETCKILSRERSFKLVVNNIDIASENDKLFTVKIPVSMFNKFFSVNVDEETYIEELVDISTKNYTTEERISIAYYNASKRRKETYIGITVFGKSMTSEFFKRITTKVNRECVLSPDQRFRNGYFTFLSHISTAGIVNKKESEEIEKVYETLSMYRYGDTVSDGIAGAYLAALMIGAKVKQEVVESFSNRSSVTMRKIVMRMIDLLENDGKVKLDTRYVSPLKNVLALQF